MTKPEDVSDILSYYDGNQEAFRYGRQQLEFQITARVLAQYLPASARILELGAGAGFYTAMLAERGHRVHAVDFSASLIEANRATIKEANCEDQVTHQVADARDTSALGEGLFDAVLVMGPLYHLVEEEERRRLLVGLRSRLNSGGLVFSAHLTRTGFLGYMLYKYPEWVSDPKRFKKLWKFGIEVNHPKNGSFRGYFTTVEEIEELDRAAGFEPVAIYAQDPVIGGVDEIYNRLPPPLKIAWADALFEVSEDRGLFGSARSLLSIARYTPLSD